MPYFKWDPTGTKDELGNTKPKWLDAQMIPVQGWDMITSEQLAEHEAEQKFDAYLMLPVDVWMGIQDRVGLPLPINGMVAPATMFDNQSHENKGIFEVVGNDIESFGPQRWTPGNVVLLKLVEG